MHCLEVQHNQVHRYILPKDVSLLKRLEEADQRRIYDRLQFDDARVHLLRSPVHADGATTLVPDAGKVALDLLMVESNTRLVMLLRATGEASYCPGCRQESRRIHSHYKRRLSDFPWEGIPVRIELCERRFFCDSKDCGQHIFTERLPKTVQRYSRRTCRLSVSLQLITSALGGSAGSRLAKQMGILASGSTLLRQLRRKLIKPSAQGPRVLGIDDWAWRKGHRYGTILCALGAIVGNARDAPAAELVKADCRAFR